MNPNNKLTDAVKHIDDMTEAEAHKMLLEEIAKIQDAIVDQKSKLKRTMTGVQRRQAVEKFEKTAIEFDALMMLKIQHELLSYIEEGGIPECQYHPEDNLFAVSIPGANVLARVNPNGLKGLRDYALEHDNPEAAQCLRAKNEMPSNPLGDTSIHPTTDNIP